MHALVGAFGTRGDVQPILALAQALRARGHRVTLAVPPNSLGFARAFGFDPLAVGMDYEEVSRRSANGSFREVMSLFPMVREEALAQMAALEEHAAGADVIVGSSVFAVGSILAERFGKPYVFFVFCPQMIPSGDHPSPPVKWHSLPRWLNRFSWVWFEWLTARLFRSTLNRLRADRRLARIERVWPSLLGHRPVLACEPALAAAPADYRVPITQVGALFLRDDCPFSPELSAFLDAGEPPVYIGFGSMSDRDPPRSTARLIESVHRAGVRAVIARGWAALGSAETPPEVLFAGAEPHAALFARCAAVIHHGGAGTTHAARARGCRRS